MCHPASLVIATPLRHHNVLCHPAPLVIRSAVITFGVIQPRWSSQLVV
jgi:hypothetical protein